MRRRMMVLAGIFAMTAFAAMPLQAAEAEPAGEESGIRDVILGEDGIIDQLFGEGGLLEGKLPEGTDVEGVMDALKEQLGKADSKIARMAESLLEKAKEKYGSYDLDSLKEILTPALGRILGDGADLGALGNLGSMDELFAQYNMEREMAADFIRGKNADILENGDVQIVDVVNVYEKVGLSEEFPYLTYVHQNNYTEDEEHQLHYLCGSAGLLLMTIHEEEDGSLTSSDAHVVEEDEEAFLKDFCGNVDTTPEDCRESIEYAKASFPCTLADYLEEHPEYTGIEYNGEMHTAEELDNIAADQLVVLYSPEAQSEETEAEAQ